MNIKEEYKQDLQNVEYLLNKQETKVEIFASIFILQDFLSKCDRLYYNYNTKPIPDKKYDELLTKLFKLEDLYPETKLETSPTQRVGSDAISDFDKVEHDNKLLSLDKSYSEEDIDNYLKRMNETDNDILKPYTVTPKIDGLSVSLKYEDGKFVQGVTRGNGSIGDDITENLKTIKSVPLKLKDNINITVRGEVFMSFEQFNNINKQREEDGLKLYKNPRNLASGTLKNLNPKVTAKRKLDVFIFDVMDCSDVVGKSFENSYHKQLNYLSKIGFKTIGYDLVYSKECLMDSIMTIDSMRNGEFYFPIDGAVIRIDEIDEYVAKGKTSKFPKGAIAYKFKTEKAITKVIDIVEQVGRTGIVTPKAIFNPVELAGTTVSQATLHNEGYIQDKDIRIGDTVVVEKAGEIIPQVVNVVLGKRPDNCEKYKFPSHCPECGYILLQDGEYIKCKNSKCRSVIKRKIAHFCSKKCMDIHGFSKKTINKLVNKNYVREFSDIYKLNKDKLMDIDKVGNKKANNILLAIEESVTKSNGEKILCGLGIDLVGKTVSDLLSKKYDTLFDLLFESKEDLMLIDGIGEGIANSIIEYYASEESDVIAELDNLGLNLNFTESKTKSNELNDKKFVLTGKLSKSRSHFKKLIKENGGKVSSSVSGKTDYLLYGKKAGSKLDKANKKGVTIITEDEFLNMLGVENA